MATGHDHDINNGGSKSGIDTNCNKLYPNKIPMDSHQVIPAVVDEKLRVIGVKRLRVADASVIPANGIPSAPIASICMAIGLAAAEYLTEDET